MDRDHYISYLREEANYEVAHLEGVLRDPRLSDEDRAVAQEMLRFYKEVTMVEYGTANTARKKRQAA